MTVSPKSKLVRFAYLSTTKLGKPGHAFGPDETSMCALFWRVVGHLVVLVGGSLGLGTVMYQDPLLLPFLGAFLLGLIAFCMGLAWLITKFAPFFKKYCPIVTFEE
jgi:hypothetical protein